MASKPPPHSSGQIGSLCKILADTTHGLTGSESERLLAQAKIGDTDPGMTKWKRRFSALATRQNGDGSADRVFAFVRLAMDPARYVGARDVFEDRRTAINAVPALCGYEFRPAGRFGVVDAASTLSEAEERAHRLRAALSARGVYPDVIAACRAELVQRNVFHAVLEASKSVAEKLRQKAGLQSDGAPLVDEALSGDVPRLRINAFTTDSERDEQHGFTNLVKGLPARFAIRRRTHLEPRGT